MTVEEFLASAQNEPQPPRNISSELLALWHTKAGNWDSAHDIAQEIDTGMGSWIHALLHLIEGDVGNAGYWFRKAGRPVRSVDDVDSLWREIVHELCPD